VPPISDMRGVALISDASPAVYKSVQALTCASETSLSTMGRKCFAKLQPTALKMRPQMLSHLEGVGGRKEVGGAHPRPRVQLDKHARCARTHTVLSGSPAG
jgi:hypothetical protein